MASQGGTHEQHVKAGQQSRRGGGDKKQASTKDGQSGSSRSDSNERQSKAGQQSNKKSTKSKRPGQGLFPLAFRRRLASILVIGFVAVGIDTVFQNIFPDLRLG